MSDTIKALEQFFNEFIAQVIPGSLLLLIGCLAYEIGLPNSSLTAFLFLGVSYLAGHIVLATDQSLRDSVDYLKSKNNKFFADERNSKESDPKIKVKDLFVSLVREKSLLIEIDELEENDLRSLAMSFSREAANLGRRFKFISLSCKSTEILMILSVPIFLEIELLKIEALYDLEINFFLHLLILQVVCMFMTIFIIYPLEVRAKSFECRAKNVPFSAAVSELISGRMTK